jgi:protein-disulfide isomerase
MSEANKSPKTIQQFYIPVLVVLAVGLAFFSGTLFQQVKNLKNGGTPTTGTTTGTTKTGTAVTLDTIKGLFGKDLIKFGDAKRKVLFVEMADPSCPYCAAADGKNHSIYKSLGPNFQLVADGGTYVAPSDEIEKLVKSWTW